MKDSISSTEGSKKWQITLAKIFNWCFLIAMILVLTCSIIFISGNDNLRHFNRFFMIGIIILAVAIGASLIYTTFRFFKNRSDTWNHRVQVINWILIILLAFTITYTVQMNYQVYDGQYCIHTAQELYPTMNWHDVPFGNKYHGQYYALIRCYNMAPLIYLQALIFKVFSLIGIKLSFAGMVTLGTYANTIMLLISMYLAFRLVKRYCRVSTQTGFTFLLLINIPLYATVYYVYTDIPALLAVMIILTAYDTFTHANNTKSKSICISIIILTSIIGALFKFNVLIALFAIIIHYFLTHNWKHNIKFILLLLIPTMLGISGAKRGITATSPIPQDELGLPATNWINMSFSSTKINGGFNEKSFKHTFNLKDKYHSNKKVSQIEIKEFITNLIHEPSKYLYIMYQKIGSTYGIGNYDFNSAFRLEYLTNLQMKNTILSQLFYGKLKTIFLYSSFVLQLSLFLFMGLGTFILIRKRRYFSFSLSWMIALFGNMFMLLFWESHARYVLAFIGVIYIITCSYIEQIEGK